MRTQSLSSVSLCRVVMLNGRNGIMKLTRKSCKTVIDRRPARENADANLRHTISSRDIGPDRIRVAMALVRLNRPSPSRGSSTPCLVKCTRELSKRQEAGSFTGIWWCACLLMIGQCAFLDILFSVSQIRRRFMYSMNFDDNIPSTHDRALQFQTYPPTSVRISKYLTDWCPRQCMGINGSFHQNELSQSTPQCYRHEVLHDSQPRTPEWDEEFRTGGSRVRQREFLCLLLKPGLKIPAWGEDFILPPGKQFLSWLDAGSLRDRWYRHPHTALPGSTKDVEDAHDVARKFCRRLEAARAARRGRRPSTAMSHLHSGQHEQDQGSRQAAGQNEIDNARKQTVCACIHTKAVVSYIN